MHFIRCIRLVLALCYAIPLVSLALLCSLCTLQLFQHPYGTTLHLRWEEARLWILGFRFMKRTHRIYPNKKPRIFMYNHTSLLDIFWLCAIGPPAFSSVTKKLFLYIPVINIVFWASGQIFIDRGTDKGHKISEQASRQSDQRKKNRIYFTRRNKKPGWRDLTVQKRRVSYGTTGTTPHILRSCTWCF